MINKIQQLARYKVGLLIIFIVLGGLMIATPAENGFGLGTAIKKAIAEGQCPASAPSSHSVIRSGGPSGPILGTYVNEGWVIPNPSTPTYVELEVPSGTVIHYASHTEGVELTNRSLGSVQSFFGTGTTVTSPASKAGYYANGYYYTKTQNITGQTNPITSDAYINVEGHNSCWGGFEDGESQLTIHIRVAGAPPAPTVRSSSTGLAVVKNPTVSLLVNGQQSISVPNGATPTLTWSTSSVNIGDSCVASNNYPTAGNPAPNWNGAKLGQANYTPPQSPPPGGGSQEVGPFTTVGTFTYSIRCYGLNNIVSSTSSVQITVGDAPSYSCSVNPPGLQSIPRGSNRSVTLQVVPLNGFNSPVDFTVASISPSAPVPPTVAINGNPQTSPYSGAATATISTNVNPATSTGLYTIQITGTGGVNCPPIQIEVTSNPGTIDIKFNNSNGPVTITPPVNSGTLSWAPTGDVANCSASMTEGEYPAWSGSRPPTGTQGVVNLEVNTRYTFKIDCVSSFGEQVQPDTVTVLVGSPPAVDPYVDLKCKGTNPVNPTFVDGVCVINSGDQAQLQASSTDATSCVLAPAIAGYTPTPNQTTTTNTPSLTSNQIYSLRCEGAVGTNSQEDSVEIRVAEPSAPTVDLKFRRNGVVHGVGVGGSINLGVTETNGEMLWITQNVQSCSSRMAAGADTSNPAWTNPNRSFTNGVDQSAPVNGFLSGDSYTFEITCVNAASQTVSDQFTVILDAPPAGVPEVDIKCATSGPSDPGFIDGPCTINSGDSAQIQAYSANVTACTLTPSIPGFIPPVNNTATTSTGPLTTSRTYVYRCDTATEVPQLEDSVTINIAVVTPNPTLNLLCGGSPVPVVAGGASGIATVTTQVTNWPGGQVNITHSSTPLTVSYLANNPNSPESTTLVSISAVSSILPGVYNIIFTGTPTPPIVGVPPATCPVSVVVSGGAVNPPTNVNATTTCGRATVTWGPPSSGPTPDGYQIFRTSILGGGGVPVFPVGPIGSVSGSTFSYPDGIPELNISSYYGVKAVLGGVASSVVSSNPVYVRPCQPSLDQSDKDLYKVDSISSAPPNAPAACQTNNPFSMPNNGIIRSGSRVYFNINVCNSGNQELTNLRIIETDLHNLSDLRLENQGGCVLGGSGTGSDPFRVSNLPEPPAPGQYTVCTVKLSAKVTTPSSTPGQLHRFWNIAYIYSNELPAGKKVSTPPYVFSIGGTPTRNETAP